MTEPTYETERQSIIAQVGECCRGADPYCAGGCLVEKALKRRAADERLLTLEERIVSWADHCKMPPASAIDTRMIHRTGGWNEAMEHVRTQLPACLRDFPPTAPSAAKPELPEGERRVLAVLLEAYPKAVDRELISEETEYKRSSRDTYLQRLKARQLVTTEGRGAVKASPTLF